VFSRFNLTRRFKETSLYVSRRDCARALAVTQLRCILYCGYSDGC